MATSTSTTTHTRVHTATYLSELVMGTIGDLLAEMGIDVTRLYRDWDQDQHAIAAWINEGSLKTVTLECHQPGGTVRPVFEFPVRYDVTGRADSAFTQSRAAMDRYRSKIESVPGGTRYELKCSFNFQASEQTGWVAATLADTSQLSALNFGTLGRGPHADVGMRYLR